jgi:hypothetical protein
VTDNHPRGGQTPESSPARAGASFSTEDIELAIDTDVAAIRAIDSTLRFTVDVRQAAGVWDGLSCGESCGRSMPASKVLEQAILDCSQIEAVYEGDLVEEPRVFCPALMGAQQRGLLRRVSRSDDQLSARFSVRHRSSAA